MCINEICSVKYHKIIISNYFNQGDKYDFSSFISALLQKDNGNKNTILKLGSDIPEEIVIQVSMI